VKASAEQDAAPGRITEVTRRRLLDGMGWLRDSVPTGFREFMEPGQTFWSGALSEIEFLDRLYDTSELPSRDRRYTTAFQDIFQHRVMNDDWPDNWVFTDERFGLADNDEALLRFLAEMLHPAVRTDPAEVERLHTFLNSVLVHDGYELVQVDAISGAPIFDYRLIGSGVRGSMKNLIFAAIGPKPDIVLDDAINNDLRIVRNCQNCLVYDRPLGADGLTWADLTGWCADQQGLTGIPPRELFLNLYERLNRSLANDAERRIMRAYVDRSLRLGPTIPALLPQVYLHYDPYTAAQRRTPGPLPRQRMDFLLLLPRRTRVVIECDGIQHYADEHMLDNERRYANPRRYAEMVAEDRELRLKGYEVYRFGGAELTNDRAVERLLSSFFDRLDQRHRS
jgi:very-short-patch-repair endonuclease